MFLDWISRHIEIKREINSQLQTGKSLLFSIITQHKVIMIINTIVIKLTFNVLTMAYKFIIYIF